MQANKSKANEAGKSNAGICIWFTGLSCSGKTTIAELLSEKLESFGRTVTLLDGDIIRKTLSKELGFSRDDRDTNLYRIAFCASEIVKHGGLVIVATISPYELSRQQVKNTIGRDRFILVFVDTPLNVCEQRDVKGLYAKARRGEITGFTGIDDPYEPPQVSDIVINTESYSPIQNVNQILQQLNVHLSHVYEYPE